LAPAREEDHSRSFDPGLSTGYLRRGAREHELPVEIGAAPFDPGPGTGYDERRARREAKHKQRLEEQRRKRLAKLEEEIERRESAEREAREREGRERRERIERKLAERERIAREARERAQREERERRLAAQRERERRERTEFKEKRRRELEARLERERREQQRIVREREERDRALRGRREREQRQRKQQARRQAKRRPTTAQRPRRPAKKPGLAWPTARAALALAAVSAVAGVFGTAIGLPVPVLREPGGPIAASLTGNPVLDAGTPPGLTRGPYFPVDTDNPDFGEADAKFGALRSGHIHRGQDVFAKPGTPLVAVRDGIVIDGAGGKGFYAYGGGNSLVIYSPVDDRSYVYLHMLRPALVRAGETVRAGQPVGQVGCTGSCFGPHLHFEIRLGRVAYGVERKAIDPLPLLQQWPAAPSQ
jgi:murein DD-endopeptidase MepM/ murein hydrolase activator NlpD